MDDRKHLREHHKQRTTLEDDSGNCTDVESRARLREQRAKRRVLRRRRFLVFGGLCVALLVIAVILGSVLSKPGGDRKTEEKPAAVAAGPDSGNPSAVKTAPSSTAAEKPQSSAPSGSAPVSGESAGVRSYFWVSFKPPEPVQKRSDTSPPTVAIVVDDVGSTRDPLPAWLAIDAPISFAVMPYSALNQEITWRLRQSGQVIMMHIPTQNAPPNSFSGKGQLSVGMSEAQVFTDLDSDVTTVPFAEGINNHQGGLGCDDLSLMTYMCGWAKQKGFYVVDSNSSNNSKVTQACLALGMPKRKNQVFIDHQNDPNYIRGAMQELAGLARKNGTAIGICHWHRPNTPTVVGEMVKQLKSEGIHFAFAKDVTN